MLIDELIGMKLNNAVEESIVRRDGCNAGDDCSDSAFGEFAVNVEQQLGQIAVIIRECFPCRRSPQPIFSIAIDSASFRRRCFSSTSRPSKMFGDMIQCFLIIEQKAV